LLQINLMMPAVEEEDYFSPEQRELRWELRSKLYLYERYPNERPGEIEGRDFQFTMDAEFMVCRCDMCGRGSRCALSQVTDAELLASWERDDREEEAELKRKEAEAEEEVQKEVQRKSVAAARSKAYRQRKKGGPAPPVAEVLPPAEAPPAVMLPPPPMNWRPRTPSESPLQSHIMLQKSRTIGRQSLEDLLAFAESPLFPSPPCPPPDVASAGPAPPPLLKFSTILWMMHMRQKWKCPLLMCQCPH
jgi:hypothetical protein